MAHVVGWLLKEQAGQRLELPGKGWGRTHRQENLATCTTMGSKPGISEGKGKGA